MAAAERVEDVSWPEDAIEVGRILGAWGIKGGIKVLPFASDPQALFSAKVWFLKPAESAKPSSAAAPVNPLKPGKAPVIPAHKTPAQKAALAAPLPFALNVKGVRVFVSRATFSQPDADEFYWIDLIGLSVVNRDNAALGDVIGLIDTGPHCVLRVKPAASEGQGEAPAEPAADERLIPFVEAYVDSVDIAGRRIVVDWGLDY